MIYDHICFYQNANHVFTASNSYVNDPADQGLYLLVKFD